MTTLSRFGSRLLVLGLALLAVSPAGAYEAETHRQLSDSAFTRSGIAEILQDVYGIEPETLFRQRIIGLPGGRRRAQQWVALGGAYEDVPFWRVLNHFYDPLRNEGLGWLGGVAAPDWALEPAGPLDGQNHSYRDARDAFYQGLTASSRERRERELGFTFFALGHVIHLIQDVAQPQHTRRDAHPPFTFRASFIEAYVERNVTEFVLSGGVMPQVAHPRELWTKGGAGLADYTNAHFVSAGTNVTELRDGAAAEGYPQPALSLALQGAIEPPAVCRDGAPAPAPLTVFGNWIVDPLTGASDLNPRMTTHSIFDQRLIERGEPPIFALNCFNVDAQADRLLRRAVGHSAALLRYFFRGQLEMEVSNAGVRIANWTPGEAMAGTFELYHDADDGTRRRLATWTVQLAPQQYSQHLSTPRLPQSSASAPCLLVFRGTLGQEADAVAGVLGPCPLEFGEDPPGDPGDPPSGDPPVVAYRNWWCFLRDGFGAISGPHLLSAPVTQDPVAWQWFLLNNSPSIQVLRCDPYVQGAAPPTY
jgi:hypothetical protein